MGGVLKGKFKMPTKNEMTVNTKDGDMKIVVMNITPKKAAELLTKNVNNRNIRDDRVSIYSAEMSAGNWKANGIPIIIGDDGVLKDGQHRLTACVKSGKTMNDAVVIYLPKTQTNCYDIGAPRTAKDVAKFMGLDEMPFYRSTCVFSAVNTAVRGKSSGGRAYSKIGLIKEMQKHPEACEFIYYKIFMGGSFHAKKLKKAGLAAAIFNAYISGFDLEKLERFCYILNSGVCREENEEPIIKLRDEVMMQKSRSRADRLQMYFMTQATLNAYANKSKTVDFKKANTEFYSYPKD